MIQGNVENSSRTWNSNMCLVRRSPDEAGRRVDPGRGRPGSGVGVAAGELRELTDSKVIAFGVMGIVSWTNRWFNPSTSSVDARSIGEAYAEILVSGLEV